MDISETRRCPHGKQFDDRCDLCELIEQQELSGNGEGWAVFAWRRLARERANLTPDQHPEWPRREQWEWRHKYGINGAAR